MSNTNDRQRATDPLVLAVSLLAVVTGAALVGTGCDSTTDDMIKPTPADRFVDNGDGTVSDMNTGLVWLKDASCTLPQSWISATDWVAGLADGQCGLTDNSSVGDWRLPTLYCPDGAKFCSFETATGEFASLFAPACGIPYVLDTTGGDCWSAGNPFIGVQLDLHWSSTIAKGFVHCAYFASGRVVVGATHHGGRGLVWPVRDRS